MTYFFWLGKDAEAEAPPIEITGPAQFDAETIEVPGCTMVQENE